MCKIFIAGGGSIGTAIGNVLAESGKRVVIYTIEPEVIESINKKNINQKYFPRKKLSENLAATSKAAMMIQAEILFLAMPSSAIEKFYNDNQEYIKDDCIIINLAKGFVEEGITITQFLRQRGRIWINSMKGPSFATEILNGEPTGITLGGGARSRAVIEALFSNTNIYVQHTHHIEAVERISILKNIYAIMLGIVDSQHNSINLRFLMFSEFLNEMKRISRFFGDADVDSLHLYCGIGDFGLTALNDLSRNRTLGLLIGKKFLTKNISDAIVFEGRKATTIYCEKLKQQRNVEEDEFPFIFELNKVFSEEYNISNFTKNILTKIRRK